MDSKIFFDPWIGKNYKSEFNLFKKKILVVGNSHYCKPWCSDCGNHEHHPGCFDFTKKVIRNYLDISHNGSWKKTFSTFVNAMLNKSSSIAERTLFFESIAFYNFLQIAAGENPYSTKEYDYANNRYIDAFYEVVDRILPDVVICWGKQVWNALSNGWNICGEAEKGAGVKVVDTIFNHYKIYHYRHHKILLIGVQHPSCGFARNFHYQIFSELILKIKPMAKQPI